MHSLGSPALPAAGPGPGPVDYGPILDALPDAVFVHDYPSGRILQVNDTCLTMFGLTSGDLEGLDVGALSSGEAGYTAGEARARMAEAWEKGRVAFTWRCRRGDGSLFWSKVRLTAVPGAVVAVVRDITARRTAEQKFEKIFRSSPAGIILSGYEDGLVEDANEVALDLLGSSREELIGTPARDLWLEAGAREAFLERLRLQGRVMGQEARFTTLQGQEKVIRLAGELLTLADGRHILSLLEDITEQKSAEAALQRITRLYAALSMVNQALIRAKGLATLYESICQALVTGGGFWAAWIATPDPDTHRFRPLAGFGGPEGWLQGLEVYASEDRPEGWGTMGRAYREKVPVVSNDFETDPLTAPWRVQARTRDFKAVASMPICRGDGSIEAVLSIYAREAGFFGREEMTLLEEVCGDITYALEDLAKEEQQRALELRLHEAQKMQGLGTLAAGVAHDMNNVLGAILGLASVEVERAQSGAGLRNTLEMIVAACTRGRDVVQGLLSFSRRDLGDLRPVDLNRVVREIVNLLSHTTLQRIRFVTDLEPALRCVEGDPAGLNHALMNLCVNAVDAMPQGGSITLRTRNGAGGTVTVEVQDTGEGMPEEILQRAAEPFFTTKPVGKGTGLGLAVVYGTVQAHRGEMNIDSHPGFGTKVRLVFPGTDALPGAEPAAVAKAPVKGLHILLVDDDEMLRETVSDVLVWQGHVPECVPGGREALAFLAQDKVVDLVILDMNMPGLSGQETLPRILALRPEQKILISSGYTDASVKALLEAHPSVRTIAKPFTTQELSRRLAEFTF